MFKKKKDKKIAKETLPEMTTASGEERDFFYNLDEIEAETDRKKREAAPIEEEPDEEIIVEEVAPRDEAGETATDLPVPDDTEDDEQDWVTEDDKLPIDVYQDHYNIYIMSPMPGVETEDIDVNINNDMVTIRGRRREQTETHQDDFFFRECYWGNVSRSVILPVEIDPEHVEATLKNGILTVTLPKVGTGRDITINVRSED